MTTREEQRRRVPVRLAGQRLPPERHTAGSVRIATEPEVRPIMALWMEVIAAARAAA